MSNVSELIEVANKIGGVGALFICIGVIIYLIYSKKRESDIKELPMQAQIVQVTQDHQDKFFRTQTEQTQIFLEAQRRDHDEWKKEQREWTARQDKKISEQAKELKTLSLEVVNLKSKIDELHGDILGRDRKLAEQQALIDKKTHEITVLKKVIEEKKARIAVLEKELEITR